MARYGGGRDLRIWPHLRENGDRGTDYGHGSVYGLRAGTKLRLAYIRRARGALLAPISWPAALMPFFEEGSPFNSTTIGIVRCKTWDSLAVAPNFRRPHASPESMPVAIAPAF
jgi:hypothetical protein